MIRILTPGSGTKRNLEWMVERIDGALEHGPGWGVAAALISVVAVPLLVAGGLLENTVVGYYEMCQLKHGNPAEYDRLMLRLEALEHEIEKLDTVDVNNG